MEQNAKAVGSSKVGLIGGLAHRAEIFYYEQILERCKLHKPSLELVLNHADVSTVLAFVSAGDKDGLGGYLGRLANELFNAGASLVAITAVAPHLAIQEISDIAKGPIVNVLDLITAGLDAVNFHRVAVFGNRAVMETAIFGAIHKDAIVRLHPDRLEQVHTLYTEIALQGKRGTTQEVEQLREIAAEVIGQGAQAIVLAGTDLSAFYAECKPEYPYIDVAQLHIDEIVKRAHRNG